MAAKKEQKKGMSKASARVAVDRCKGELAALETELSYGKRKDEVADAIKSKKAELAKYEKAAG